MPAIELIPEAIEAASLLYLNASLKVPDPTETQP